MAAAHVIPEDEAASKMQFEQMDLFTDYAALQKEQKNRRQNWREKRRCRRLFWRSRRSFGKNAILKGMNLEEGATARDRTVR